MHVVKRDIERGVQIDCLNRPSPAIRQRINESIRVAQGNDERIRDEGKYSRFVIDLTTGNRERNDGFERRAELTAARILFDFYVSQAEPILVAAQSR
jgi:hypothetical protein